MSNKPLVERNWIKLWDSVEPLDRPLKELSSYERRKMKVGEENFLQKQREYSKEYRERPDVKEKTKKYAKEYAQRPAVKKRLTEYKRKYWKKHKDKLNEYHRNYRRKNKEKHSA